MLVTKFAAYLLPLVLIAPASAQSVGGFGASGRTNEGPGILGRGGPTAGKHGTESHPFQVRGTVNASYDTSMLGYLVDGDGNLSPQPSTGATFVF